MSSSFTPTTVRRVAITGLVVLVFGVGVWQVLKSTVDHLLYWDATAAAESWAKYVAENVTDLEDIADHTVIGDFKDGGILVFVDGDDGARALHTHYVLNCAADSQR